MDKSKLYFFLGGKDLKMDAIKAILTEHHISFTDGGLSWGLAPLCMVIK